MAIQVVGIRQLPDSSADKLVYEDIHQPRKYEILCLCYSSDLRKLTATCFFNQEANVKINRNIFNYYSPNIRHI